MRKRSTKKYYNIFRNKHANKELCDGQRPTALKITALLRRQKKLQEKKMFFDWILDQQNFTWDAYNICETEKK